MNTSIGDRWYLANYQYLLTAVASVVKRVEDYINQEKIDNQEFFAHSSSQLQLISQEMEMPPSLEQLSSLFNLSSFERNIVLMGVAMAVQPKFAALCAKAHQNQTMAYPTFNLAMEVFPNVHWSALTPQCPLRSWQILEVGTGTVIPFCPLQIDETILHWLMGEPYQDSLLMRTVQSVLPRQIILPLSYQEISQQIATLFLRESLLDSPVIQLCGREVSVIEQIVSFAAELLAYPLKTISALHLPLELNALQIFVKRWQRERLFTNSILLLNCDSVSLNHLEIQTNILQFIEEIKTPVIISTKERITSSKCPLVNLDVPSLTPLEQRSIWEFYLGTVNHNLNGEVNQLVAQFNLSPTTIKATCHQFQAQKNDQENQLESKLLWELCRIQARPHLDDLSQRIESTANWQDLVIPEREQEVLQEIAAHLRQRSKVYQEWGFAHKSKRGLGLSALFSGPSGTGKTMAAEVLAKELNLDLYRIDLSAVVSKYIGETEKNLRRIFDAAETGGAILLFDEADALFGKRTQVKDSHDRHANVEVSYLLQRMEAYQGLAILTTNLKDSLDAAFLRRIRFVVHFPFPNEKARMEIWRRIFPVQTPTEGLDFKKLGRLNISGGNIRNIAINAAILAADAEESVMMKHILKATQSEYLKLERTLTENEIKGWI